MKWHWALLCGPSGPTQAPHLARPHPIEVPWGLPQADQGGSGSECLEGEQNPLQSLIQRARRVGGAMLGVQAPCTLAVHKAFYSLGFERKEVPLPLLLTFQ